MSGSGARARHRRATTRLVCSRSAFASVVVLFTGLTQHRKILHRASITILIMGLALHQHALCRLSLAWLGFHAELSV
jgi:hypothetical protein